MSPPGLTPSELPRVQKVLIFTKIYTTIKKKTVGPTIAGLDVSRETRRGEKSEKKERKKER